MAEFDCLACMKVIADDLQSLTCAECNKRYHTGKCSGVTKSNLKNLSTKERQQWVCLNCANCAGDGDCGSHKAKAADASAEPSLTLVLAKLDVVLRRLDALEKRQDAQLAKFESSNQEMLVQSTAIQGIETALELLSSKYDTILQKLEGHEKELKETQKKSNRTGSRDFGEI